MIYYSITIYKSQLQYQVQTFSFWVRLKYLNIACFIFFIRALMLNDKSVSIVYTLHEILLIQ